MFFIFGWGHQQTKNLGRVFMRHCGHCDNEVLLELHRISTWFTLFFIPVLPYEKKNILMCPICNYGFELDDVQFDQLRPLAEANESLIEGTITQEEHDNIISRQIEPSIESSEDLSQRDSHRSLKSFWRSSTYTSKLIAVIAVIAVGFVILIGLSLLIPTENERPIETVQVDPNDADAWVVKGWEFVATTDYAEAVKCYDRAIEIDPKNVDAYIGKVCVLSDTGHHEEAIGLSDKVIEIDPSDADAWDIKGVVLYRVGRYAEAIKCYDKVIEIEPKNDGAWYGKGRALRGLSRYAEAIDCIHRAIQINPEAYSQPYPNQ